MDRNTFLDVLLPLLREDTLPVINWLKHHNLLASEVNCADCGQKMNWAKYTKTKDGFIWKSQVKDCSKYKSTRSIRIGSFFANSNLSLQTWVHAIYLWTENIGEKLASRQLNISEKNNGGLLQLFS